VATQRTFRFFAIFLYLFLNYATGNRQVIIIFIIIAQLIYLVRNCAKIVIFLGRHFFEGRITPNL